MKLSISYENAEGATMVVFVLLPTEANFGLGIFAIGEDDVQLGEGPFFSLTRGWLEEKIAEAQGVGETRQ